MCIYACVRDILARQEPDGLNIAGRTVTFTAGSPIETQVVCMLIPSDAAEGQNNRSAAPSNAVGPACESTSRCARHVIKQNQASSEV